MASLAPLEVELDWTLLPSWKRHGFSLCLRTDLSEVDVGEGMSSILNIESRTEWGNFTLRILRHHGAR
jgi:hypothetical protein